MVEILDRRVTRSLSNELKTRAAVHSSYLRSNHEIPNSYAAQQHQNNEQYMPHSHAQGYGDNQSNRVAHHHMTANEGDYLRNTSDDMFLSNLIVTGTPSMEVSSLGFLDMPSNLQPPTMRGNSEELFRSWITNSNTESSNQNQNGVYPDPSTNVNRPRQNSRRMSSELQAVIAQQSGAHWASKAENGEQAYMQANPYLAEDLTTTMNNNHKSQRNNPLIARDKRWHGPVDYSPLGPLKNMQDWLSASTPMTRSRSSELRRRYAQLEGLPFPPSSDAFHKLPTNGTIEGLVNPAVASLGAFARGINGSGSSQNDQGSKPMVTQSPLGLPMSSPAPLNHKQLNQQQQAIQHGHLVVSDVVGLLKGSLERKKLQTKQEQEQNQQQHQPRSVHSPLCPPQGHAQEDESLNRSHDQIQGENGLFQVKQTQQSTLPQAHSPSGSSEAAPSHSAGIANSDGPSNSCMSDHRQALKRGNAVVDQPSPNLQSLSCVDSPNAHSNGEVYEFGTPRTDMMKKSDHLARAGSITSSLRPGFQLNEIDGATKKRRVERQRKMAEAKGRGNAPPLPADLQAAIKRCDMLEKEVRSLKLNLSFMNRKDSEQTKRIEELEQQNEDLKEEKVRLLEELQRLSTMNEAE